MEGSNANDESPRGSSRNGPAGDGYQRARDTSIRMFAAIVAKWDGVDWVD
jgi:hypothetical protein